MTMKKREKILAGVAGGALVLLVGWFLLASGEGPSSSQLRADRKKLAGDVEKKEAKVQAARRSSGRLNEWQRRALPADASNARSLYQNWLRGLADRANLRQLNIDSNEGQSRRNVFTLFSFTVRGRATLTQLIRFMYGFYSAGHLHQIRRLDIKPVENAKPTDGAMEFEVAVTIEAMSLPASENRTELCKLSGEGLKLAKSDLYSEVIAKRNLFGLVARPEPRRERPKRPEFDPVQFAFITAILDIGGRGEVWLVDRIADRTWHLRQGERFEVGQLRGSIQAIGAHDVVVELDGQRRRLRYGDNLYGGQELRD